MDAPEHPDAVAPERQHFIAWRGGRLRLHEWGDPDRPPVVLTHGAFDHGRGFDMLAPRLAEHFRVVAIDSRGHGDSDWADTYMWPLDVLDIVNVLRWLDRPAHLVGHSKGGGQATDAAVMAPARVRQLVNMDGFGPPDDAGFRRPGDDTDLSRTMAERCADFLDAQRGAAEGRAAWRPRPSFDDLVERRGQQNPRLERGWLRYFCYHAARRDADGWRWKVDPQMAGGGFGPFKAEWIAPSWTPLRAPMLAMVGTVEDVWGPLPEPLLSERLGFVSDLSRVTIDGAGHFLHMEKPDETARAVLGFLDR